MNKLRQVTFNAMCLLAAFLPAATAMDTMEIIVDASSDGKYYESVYGLSEIGEIKPRSAAELISDAAGLNITSKSFPLLQAHARVNGGSFEQVLIFLDGFRMNSVQTGHYNFDLPVTMLDIAAAGVSGRAGYGAFSGFVDLMTIRHEKDALRAAAEYGSYDTWYSAFSGTKVIGDFSATLSAENSGSAGYHKATDYLAGTYFMKLENRSFGYNSLSAGYSEKDYGAFDFYTPGKNLPSREYVSTRYAKIESEPFDFLSAEAHVKSHYDHFILNADNPVYQNRHTEWVYGGSVKGEYRFSEGLLAQLSYAFDREEILSSKLGTRSRNRHAADLTCGYEFESLTLTGSLGTEKYDVYPGFETLRSASATYRISEEISLKAWLGRGIRYPNFTELYYSDPYTVGNAGLDPELCDDYGAGADFNTGTVNARVSAIFRNAFGLIDWGKESPSDTYWQAKNIGLVSTAGLNADVSAALGPVKVSAAYSVYDYIISRQYLPKYGASYLKNRLSASLDADVLGFSCRITYAFRNYINRQDYCSETGISVSRKVLDNLEVTIRADDVFDRRYEDSPGIPAPGRMVSLRLEGSL